MQNTYWLEQVLKMISLYVNALLCTPQHIVIHTMQLSGVNSENWHRWVTSRVWQYAAACTKVHWRTRRSFSAPSVTSKYFAFAFVQFPVQGPRPTPTLVYETAGGFFARHSVEKGMRAWVGFIWHRKEKIRGWNPLHCWAIIHFLRKTFPWRY